MAVMQPRENVYISTQIENITDFVFTCVREREREKESGVGGLLGQFNCYPQFACLFDYELVQVMGFIP